MVHRRRGTEFRQRVRNIHATAATNAIRDNRVLASARSTYEVPAGTYTGSETPPLPPAHGTIDRARWESKIQELRALGWSYLDISSHPDVMTSESTVGYVCRNLDFVKGAKK